MKLTNEQSAVVDYINTHKSPKKPIVVLINAVAGAGKTALLTAITAKVPHTRGIYLAYNKSVALEAKGKFPNSIACSTTHSLAYRAVVKDYGLKVGNFSYRSIKGNMPYEVKQDIVDEIRSYCLSKYVEFDDYCKQSGLSKTVYEACTNYLTRMYDGEIECSHDFYLKVFHIHLDAGDITYDDLDFLLIDESGDLNEVTLEIFRLIPAQVKIAVGDNCQNIYGFNNTVNAFSIMEGKGELFKLTRSFRVSVKIAKRIEKFCRIAIDPTMEFKGTDSENNDIVTTAYLSRTNAGMVSAMLELAARNQPFNTVRNIRDIFRLPLSLAFLKYQGEISDPAYKHIQTDVDDWYEDADLRKMFPNVLSYLGSLYTFDVPLSIAISLVARNGVGKIMTAYNFAKECQTGEHATTVGTGHSVKGLEFDRVIVGDDLNKTASSALGHGEEEMSEEEKIQELNLYYVVCSRARKELLNAKILDMV